MTFLRFLVPTLLFVDLASCQVDLRTPPPAPTNTVPYTGATRDLDLGAFNLIAKEIRTTGAQSSAINLSDGPCPTAPPAGFHATMCLENGIMFLLSATAKVPLNTRPQTDVIPLSSLTFNAQGVANVTLTKMPASSAFVRVARFSSVAGEYIADELVLTGKALTITANQRPFTGLDLLKITYRTVEP